MHTLYSFELYPLLTATGNSHWLNFDASCQVGDSNKLVIRDVPNCDDFLKLEAVDNHLDLLAQELFVLKSEEREALESLLRGKGVFCVLPTGLGPFQWQ